MPPGHSLPIRFWFGVFRRFKEIFSERETGARRCRHSILLGVLALILSGTLPIHAADVFFVGPGTDWETGSNWSTGSKPTNTDKAIFDVGSISNCSMSASVDVGTIEIRGTYANALDFNDQNVTVRTALTQAAGTLSLGNGTITLDSSGTWTINGGPLNSEGSTVRFVGTNSITNSHSLTNVTFSNNSTGTRTVTITAGQTLTVTGLLAFDSTSSGSLTMNGGTIEAQGDITTDNRFYEGTATVLINGGGVQTLTGTAGQTSGGLPNIDINTAGSLNLVGTIRTGRKWTVTAGTVNAGSSTVVFRPFNTTQTVLTGSHTLNNVTFDSNSTSSRSIAIAAGTTLTVSGTLNFDNSTSGSTTINGGTIAAQGNIITDQRFYGGSATLLINGGGNQTLTGIATQTSGELPNIVINKAGTLALAGMIRIGRKWTLTAGAIDAGTSTVVFRPQNTSQTVITGSHTLNNVIFDSNSSSSRSIAIAAGTTLTVTGTLKFDNSSSGSSTINGGTIEAQGDISTDNRFYEGSATVLINGGGVQTLTGAANQTNGGLPNININTTGTFNLVGTIRTGRRWTFTAGTVNAGTSTVVFRLENTSQTVITGSHTLNNVAFNSNSSSSRSAAIAAGTTLTVAGTLTFDNTSSGPSAINGGAIAAQGDVNVGAGSDFSGSTTLRCTGAGAQLLTLVEEEEGRLNLDIRVNKSGAQLTLGSYLIMDATNQDLIVEEGTLDIEGQALQVSGTGSTFVVEDGGTFQFHGDETTTQPTLNSGSTVTYDGTVGPYTVLDWAYHHLTFNGPGAAFNLGADESIAGNLSIVNGAFDISGFNLTVPGTFSNEGTFRLQGGETTVSLTMDTDSGTVEYDGTVAYASLKAGNAYFNLTFNGIAGSWQHTALLDVNGDLSLTNGTLDSNGQNIALAGDWANSAAYTSGANTVTLDGTNQALSGNNTFNNLTKTVAAAASLTFEASMTQTVAGTLTLQGAAGNLLTLQSSQGGTQWRVDPQGVRSIANLEVIDSNNIHAAVFDATGTGSVDGGNNTNWLFDAATGFVWQGDVDANFNTPGNWAGGAVPGNTDVAIFSGAFNADCTINTAVDVAGFDIRGAYSGTLTQGAGNTITVGASGWNQAGGTFTGGNANIDLNGDLTFSGGTFTSTSAELKFSGNWASNSGTPAFNANGGTLRLDVGAATRTIDSGALVFNNVIISGDTTNGHYIITGTMDINGNLTVASIGSLNTGTLAVAGNVTTTDAGVSGTGIVLLDGSGAQALGAGGGTGQLPNVAINNVGGTLTLQDTLEIPGNWTYTAGTVAGGASTVRFVVGNATRTIDSGSMEFNDVDFNGDDANGHYTITGTLFVGGDLSLTQIGDLNGGTIAVAGNLTSTHATVGGTAGVLLYGANNQSVNIGAFDLPGGPFTVDKSAGTATLASVLSLNEAGQDLFVTSGTLDLVGLALTVNDVFSIEANGTLQLYGTQVINKGPTFNGGTVAYNAPPGAYLLNNWDYYHLTFNAPGAVYTLGADEAAGGNLTLAAGTLDIAGYNFSAAGTFSNDGLFRLQGGELVTLNVDTNSGTVEYNGTGVYSDLATGLSYFNLIFSGSGSWSAPFNVDANGSLTISNGTFMDGGWTIRVAGDWVQSGTGSFTATGLVILDGTSQALSGSTTFNNLSKTTVIANTLTFANGATQTVAGTLTLQGAVGNRLSLRSDSDGDRWNINPQGTRSLLNLDVKDSDNVNGTAIDATGTNSVNSGNNNNWIFDAASGFTWEGDVDANWNTPGNWVGGTVPGSANVAVFDGTVSNNDCTVNVGLNVNGIDIRSSYTGTITAGTVTLPAVTGGQAGLAGDMYDGTSFENYQGTFIDGSVNFNPADTLLGTNRAGGPDTYSARWTGQVKADFGETYTFYTNSDDGVRLWVNGQQVINNWTLHGPTEDSGAIALAAGQWYDIQLEFFESGGGSVIQLSYSSASETKKIIPSTHLRTVARAAANIGVGLSLNSSGFSQAGGTFNGVSSPLSLTDGSFTLTGGTFNAPDETLTVDRNWTFSGGSFNAPAGTVKFNAPDGDRTITGTTTFNGLTFDINTGSTRTYTLAGGLTLIVNGTLTLDNSGSGTTVFNGGTIEAKGDISTDNRSYAGSTQLLINGGGTQTLTGSASQTAGDLLNIEIDTVGTLNLAGTIRTGRKWTVTAGTIDAGTSTLVFRAENTSQTVITGNHTLNNVIFDSNSGSSKSVAIASGTTLTVSGALVFDNSSSGSIAVNGGTIEAQGDISTDNRFYEGSATILINGGGVQTLTGAANQTNGGLPNIEINTAGTLNLVGTIRTGRRWTVTAGTINAGTSTVVFRPENTSQTVITGSHTLNNVTFDSNSSSSRSVLIASGTTLTVSGTLVFDNSSSGTAAINGGTIEAQGDITTDNRSYDGSATVLINGGGVQTFTGAATQTSGGLPNIVMNTAGTLNLVGTLRVGRNWTYTAGTINPGASTVVFQPNSNKITGSHALNNVIINSASSSTSTLTIDTGAVLTVLGSLLLDNTSTGPINLNSGTLAAQGNVTVGVGSNFGGSATLSFTGTAAQSFDLTGGENRLNTNVVVNKPSNAVTLASALTLDNAGQDLTITSGTFNMSTFNLTIVDELSIGGALVQGSGTLDVRAITLSAGSWTNESTGDVTLGSGGVTNNGFITLDGTAPGCGDADGILIRSSASPTQRSWSGGGVFTLHDVDVQDQAGSALITVFSGTNTGNNGSNWNFVAACPSKAYWIGNTAGNFNTNSRWSTSSGGTNDRGVPTVNDIAVFDAGGTGACAMAADVTLRGLEINLGYPSTVTQNAGVTLTVGIDGLAQAAGTFTGGNSAIDVNGAFTFTGGTFAGTSGQMTVSGDFTHSGGTFTHNNGTVVLDNTLDNTLTVSPSTTFNHFKLETLLENGLVGHFKLDETATTSGATVVDSSSVPTNGTPLGAGGANNLPQPSVDVPPAITFTNLRSLSFDGTDDYVSINGIANKVTSNLTISYWVKAPAIYTSASRKGAPFIINSSTGGNVLLIMIGDTANPANDNELVVYDGGTIEIATDTVVADNTWHHIAYQRSGSTGAVYIDGVLKGTHTANFTLASTDQWSLGQDFDGGTLSDLYQGQLDDVRIFNRALSGTEIQNLASGNQNAITNAVTTLAGAALNVDGDLALNSGTLDVGGSNLGITLAGSWLNFGGEFTARAGTVTLDGTAAGKSLRSRYQHFNNLMVNGSGGVWTLADRLNVDAVLTLTAGELDVNVGGNYVVHAGTLLQGGGSIFDAHAGTVVVDAPTSQTLTVLSTVNTVRIEDSTETGLVGYWKLDEGTGSTARDSSAGGSSGSLINAPAWSTSVSGSIAIDNASCLDFNGTNQSVSVGDVLNVGDTADFSVSGWFNRDTATTDDVIFAKRRGTSAGNVGYLVYLNALDDKLYLEVSDGVDEYRVRSITSFSAPGWNQFTIVWDQDLAAEIKIYINGVEVGTETAGTLGNIGSLANTENVRIGAESDGGNPFDGRLDEIRFYNRALTALEAANLGGGRYADGDSGTATYSLGSTLNATAALAIDSGVFSPGTFDVTLAGVFNLAGGNGLYQGGSGTQTFNGGVNISGSTFNGGSGIVDVNGAFNMSGGAFTSTSSNLNLSGDFVFSGGTFGHNNATVDFDGATTVSGASTPTFNNVVITGTLAGHAGTLNVDGGWTKIGTFNHNGGTVSFTGAGASVLLGSTVFNNFDAQAPSKTLTFQAGTTQVVSGAFTVDGQAAGTRIQLQSSSPGSVWSIDPQGTRTVRHVVVQDSTNLTGPAINPFNSLDAGNTTLWFDLTANATATPNPVLFGQATTLASNPVGGSGVYTSFIWTGPNGFTSTLQNPGPVLPPQSDGLYSYTLVVTDSNLNTATAILNVGVAQTALTNSSLVASASPPGVVLGGTSTLSVTGTGGSGTIATYVWTGPNGFLSSLPSPLVTPPNLGANVYTVTVTDTFGFQATIQITVFAAATPVVANPAVSPAVEVVGQNVILSSNPSGGSGVYVSYSWTGPNGFSSTIQNPGAFTLPFEGVFDFTLTVTDSYGLVSTQTVTAFAVGSALFPNPQSTSTLIALGETVTLSSAPTGGTGIYLSYNWTGPNGWTFVGQNPGVVQPPILGVNTYTLTIVDASGLIATASIDVVAAEGLSPSGLFVKSGGIKYKLVTGSTSLRPDAVRLKVKGLDLKAGDRIAFAINGMPFGNLPAKDGMMVPPKGSFKGLIQSGSSGGTMDARMKYSGKRRQLRAMARGTMGQGPLVQNTSGMAPPVLLSLYVDRAPADGVVDQLALVPIVFKVKVRQSKQGIQVEKGKGRSASSN